MINYFLHILISGEIIALFAMGLQLEIGETGLYNFGHVAFFGIGAYASSLLSLAGLPFPASLGLALLVTGVITWFIGIPLLRLRGDYFGLAMLGFGEITRKFFLNESWLTKGPMGLPGIPRPSFLGFNIHTLPEFALFYGILVIFVYLIIRHIIRSPLGRVFTAIRDDDLSASAIGKNTYGFRRLCLITGALAAGLSGALWAHYITFISPSDFTLNETILALLIIVLGGNWGITGALVSSFFVIGFQEGLRFLPFPDTFGRYIAPVQQMIFGLILVLLVLNRPGNLIKARHSSASD